MFTLAVIVLVIYTCILQLKVHEVQNVAYTEEVKYTKTSSFIFVMVDLLIKVTNDQLSKKYKVTITKNENILYFVRRYNNDISTYCVSRYEMDKDNKFIHVTTTPFDNITEMVSFLKSKDDINYIIPIKLHENQKNSLARNNFYLL